jgi:hypothetical protein
MREIHPLNYQEFISYGNRTNLACLKYGYCYICYRKKEKSEKNLTLVRNTRSQSSLPMVISHRYNRNTRLTGEDPGFDPSAISDSDVEKRRILEEENMRKQLDRRMREQGKAKEEYVTTDVNADPILILLRDLDDDIGNLSEEMRRIQVLLARLESKVDRLLESKFK